MLHRWRYQRECNCLLLASAGSADHRQDGQCLEIDCVLHGLPPEKQRVVGMATPQTSRELTDALKTAEALLVRLHLGGPHSSPVFMPT